MFYTFSQLNSEGQAAQTRLQTCLGCKPEDVIFNVSDATFYVAGVHTADVEGFAPPVECFDAVEDAFVCDEEGRSTAYAIA